MLGVSFYVCNDTLNSVFPPSCSRSVCQWSCLNECVLCSFVCFRPRSRLRCGIIWSNNSLNILIRLCVCVCVCMGAKQWLSVASGPAGVRPYLGTTSLLCWHIAPPPHAWAYTPLALTTNGSLAITLGWHCDVFQLKEIQLHKGFWSVDFFFFHSALQFTYCPF